MSVGMVTAASAGTFYIRTDGGDTGQCTGQADAPYPGRGTAQACAWKHPFLALPPGGKPRITAGDTLMVGSGSYTIGPGEPGAGDCEGADCHMPPLPSGRTAAARTRFLGKSASAKPRLLGTHGVKLINLEGSSNVEVGNLELTDQHDCVYQHSHRNARCPDSGNWAKTGVSARASNNVRLHDLDIHGMGHQGILAAGLTDWVVERVKLVANGRVGWEGNIGASGNSSNSGTIVLRDVEIGWNGCGERWQSREPWACWAQKSGGYGDGLATTHTGGQWRIENAFIHHNTSDGLDLRYMDGSRDSSVSVDRLHAVGNAGNQVKIRGSSTIENSVIVGNCGYFRGKHFMLDGDHCRAGGNALQLVLSPGASVRVRHNTIAGEGGVLVGTHEGDRSARVRIENNVLVGFPAFGKAGVLAAAHYANDAPAPVDWAGNLVWNVKNANCPGDSICRQHPKLANMTLAGFNAEPLPGSPVIGRAAASGRPINDFRGSRRPAKADIGAIQARKR